MSSRIRFAFRFVLALWTTPFVSRSVAAQQSLKGALAPAPTEVISTPAVGAESRQVPTGPTFSAASVGVRPTDAAASKADAESVPARRGGGGQPATLIVVGGAAILVGLLIGGGAGGAIAVGGAVVGLIGLYQYLQ